MRYCFRYIQITSNIWQHGIIAEEEDFKMQTIENELISIVLPVYNVEKYLERCIFSIINQSYSKLEIILVNDGSTDGSGQICEEWAEKDSRIILVNKTNAGLGMARNTGLEKASGKYICFIDSDDYVESNMIEIVYEEAQKNNADIVMYGFYNVNSDGVVVDCLIPGDKIAVFSGEKVTEELLPNLISKDPKNRNTPDYWMSAWTSIYKRETLTENNLCFVSEREIISEDIYSLLSFYKYMNTVVVIPKALYYYCQNSVSLTHKYQPDRYEKIKHFYLEAFNLCIRLDYNKDVIYRLQMPFFYFTVSALKQEAKMGTFHGLKRIIDDETLQKVICTIRNDCNTILRKILLSALHKKRYFICYLFLKVKP